MIKLIWIKKGLWIILNNKYKKEIDIDESNEALFELEIINKSKVNFPDKGKSKLICDKASSSIKIKLINLIK